MRKVARFPRQLHPDSVAKQASQTMPGHTAIHGDRQQYGSSGHAMDWEKDMRNMKDIIAAILIAAVVIAVEVSGIPKGTVQINEYQKEQMK